MVYKQSKKILMLSRISNFTFIIVWRMNKTKISILIYFRESHNKLPREAKLE